jgi:hypothetical protein
MNEWAAHRKRVILFIVLSILIVLVGGPLYFFFHKAPSCFDTKQNGDETGVDCGGSCQIVCSAGTFPLLMKGDPQVLKIASTTYEVIASIQNPNLSAKILHAAYTFRIFEEGNPVSIKIIQGTTYIPKNASFVIFKGPFDLGGSIPNRATFEWNPNSLVWLKDTTQTPQVTVHDALLSKEDTEPRLDATVSNDTLVTVSNIEFVTLVMDENSNTIASSKTFVDSITPGGSAPIVFTWPNAFTSTTTTFEIIPRILPDKSYIE